MQEAYNNFRLSSHDTLHNNLAVMEVNAITSSTDLFLSQSSLAPQRAYRSGVELHADSAPVTQACERVTAICCLVVLQMNETAIGLTSLGENIFFRVEY